MNILKKIYHSKYFPRLFYVKPDGGRDSRVTGYFLIEWKWLFSIAILKFEKGSREAYHSHAFNAYTWWISGKADEVRQYWDETVYREYERTWKPKYTPRDNVHKVLAYTRCWCITIRGPWEDTWYEYKNGENITLTHGRKVV